MADIPDQQSMQAKANDILKEPSVPNDKPLDLNQLVFKSMPKGLFASKRYITPQAVAPVANTAPVSALGEMTGTAAHQQASSAPGAAAPANSLLSSIPVNAAPASHKNFLIGIVAVLVILAAAAGVYFFVFRKPAASNQTLTVPAAITSTPTAATTPATSSTSAPTPTTTTPTATPTPPANTSVLTAAWLLEYFPTEAPNGVCSGVELAVCGDSADPDSDGLTNAQEFKLGTNPTLADTDQDGIADGDEVNVFDTNPLTAHTSGIEQYTDAGDISHMYNSTAKAPMSSIDMTRIAAAIKEYGLHAPTTTTLSQATIEAYTNYTAPAASK